MENRFGIKDLFLFAALILIVVMLGLCLVQYDRQWKQIQELKGQTNGLANDLSRISSRISSGAIARSGNLTTQGAQSASGDGVPYPAIAEARAKPDFAEGDWLVENFGTNIGKLTPLMSTDVYAAWVQAKTMESLAYRDPKTLKYEPLLATDWTVSPDGKTLHFNLRDNVVFSDGVPMTAKDVVFTFNQIMNPAVDAARSRAYLDHIESVTADNDYAVTFKFKEFKFNTFSTVVETLIMPEHFYSKFSTKDFNEQPGLLMGTGPYRMATPEGWRPGQRVEIVRNERYWGGRPAVDRILYYEVKDDVVEETMYRNRELDRFAPTPEQYEKLKNDKSITDRSTTWNYFSPVSGYTFVGWNQRQKVADQDTFKPTKFADARVRRAMTMMIDRERLARELYMGHAQPAVGPFGYGSPQTDPEIKPVPFDVEGAKKLLKDAGYEDRNGDGTIDNADGTPFSFALTYGSGNPFTERIVLFMKDSFARAGVKMELNAVDWPILIKKLDTRDFEAVTLGWSTSIETDCNQIFHSSQTKDQGDNFINYISPQLDAAIEKARTTVDENERMNAWRAVHRIIAEDQPYTFLLSRESLAFIDSRFKNIEKTKMGLNMVLTEMTPFPWYVPRDQQLHKSQN